MSIKLKKDIAMTTASLSEDGGRATELEAIVDEMIVKIMLHLNQKGYGTAEILAALDDVCDKRHHEYLQDPDPADDPTG